MLICVRASRCFPGVSRTRARERVRVSHPLRGDAGYTGAPRRAFASVPGTHAQAAVRPLLGRPSAFEAAAQVRDRARVRHVHRWPHVGLGTDNGQKGGG